MTKKVHSIVNIVLFILLFFASQGVVKAQEELPPAMPSCFYGTVTVNGAPAAVGSEISAWINGEKIAWTEVEYFSEDETYVYALKITSDGSFEEGAAVEFRLNDEYIADEKTAVWREGTNVNLDLTFIFSPNDPHQIFLPMILR